MKKNDFEKDIEIIESIIEEYESCSVPEIDMQVDVAFGQQQNNALKHLLSNYTKVLSELQKYKNMYEAEHEIHMIRNEQLERKENSLSLKQFDIDVVYNDYLEKLNEYKKNSIQKQTIKEVIKELEDNICRIKKQYSNGGENCNTAYLENLAQVKILKQILKESVK